MKKSIEVEYWVIDREGELVEPGKLVEGSEQRVEEFVEPLFELKTTPCETTSELRTEFVERLDDALSVAGDLGKGLVPLGTPIDGGSIRRLRDERSRIQRRVLGEDFEYAKHCAGTHVHFEQRDATEQLNALIALDPALALLNSSPYFRGKRVAAGARAYAYRKKCYEQFPKHGQLWDYVESVSEWNERLEHRFEDFVEAAIESGVDRRDVEANFSPDDVVWTPVRLRKEFPTVEWRSPDAALPSEILRLAGEMNALIETLPHRNVRIEGEHGGVSDDRITLPEFDQVWEYVDRAIHDGLESKELRSYLGRMGFDVGSYRPISARIDGRSSIDRDEACDLRLEYARELERDVERLLERNENGRKRV
ncbi:glutamate-cysteine ligase family protein [Halalkalicoccus ordinarius]|uniref:glutamate-cysteine ligase family protein n=1 Tax=Halalkalicoccus ordinarius TaxID=3116651 RepID=UPI00300EF4E5